jgi:hypothetical protein
MGVEGAAVDRVVLTRWPASYPGKVAAAVPSPLQHKTCGIGWEPVRVTRKKAAPGLETLSAAYVNPTARLSYHGRFLVACANAVEIVRGAFGVRFYAVLAFFAMLADWLAHFAPPFCDWMRSFGFGKSDSASSKGVCTSTWLTLQNTWKLIPCEHRKLM